MQKELLKEIIKDLEKKQTEIYTDIEDMEWTEQYANGYTDAWLNAFDLAMEIVKFNWKMLDIRSEEI